MELSIDKMNGQRHEVDDYDKKIKMIKEATAGGEITLEGLKEIGIDSSDLERLIADDILEKGEDMGEETIFTLKEENIPESAEKELDIYDEAA